MPALPAASDFTGSTRTNLQMKTTFSDLRGFLSGLLGADGAGATALATLGALGAGQVDKAAAYTVVLGDRGDLINATTGTWTLTLPAAAMAGAGFAIALRNSGSGVITIDANAAELVNGVATLAVNPGFGGVLVCTGTAWLTIGGLSGDAQASVTDSATGKLMRVGAFGWGANDVTAPVITDLDAMRTTGNWRFTIGATGAPETNGLLIHSIRIAGVSVAAAQFQLVFGVSGSIYRRVSNAGGTWDAWVTLPQISAAGMTTIGGNAVGWLALTIADDAAGTITVPRQGGFAAITCNGATASPNPEFSGRVYYDAGTTLQIIKATDFAGLSANLNVVTTDVTGTSGTDGFVTVAVQAGVLKIENRSGASKTFQVTFS